jgi:adenosine deaminase
MAGDELKGKPGDFLWSFDCAREAGCASRFMRANGAGRQSVRDALDALNPERIGHGVQAIDGPALVDRWPRTAIVLECCPGSNVSLGVFPSWRKHPIETLRARGVKVTVSTDDPPFFHTTMTAEYENLARAFDWDEGVFAEIAQPRSTPRSATRPPRKKSPRNWGIAP